MNEEDYLKLKIQIHDEIQHGYIRPVKDENYIKITKELYEDYKKRKIENKKK